MEASMYKKHRGKTKSTCHDAGTQCYTKDGAKTEILRTRAEKKTG